MTTHLGSLLPLLSGDDASRLGELAHLYTYETGVASEMSGSACTKFVRRVANAFQDNRGHDYNCLRNLEILRAKPGHVLAKMKIEDYQVNRLKSLHGGLICSLVDLLGSLAVSSRGLYMTGVSTDIHATFLRPAGKVNDTVLMTGEVQSMGKTLAFTKIALYRPETEGSDVLGKLVAEGTHTKYILDAVKNDIGAARDGKNVKFDESGERLLEGEVD